MILHLVDVAEINRYRCSLLPVGVRWRYPSCVRLSVVGKSEGTSEHVQTIDLVGQPAGAFVLTTVDTVRRVGVWILRWTGAVRLNQIQVAVGRTAVNMVHFSVSMQQ